MILQTDPSLPEEIHTFGCYFTSLLYHAEKRLKRDVKSDEVLSIFKAAKQTGIIGKDCLVQDPVALLHIVGVRVGSVVKAGPLVVPSAIGFEILHFHRDADTPKGQGNSVHDHFVAGDGTGKVIFDPLGKSNTVKYGHLQDKRIFS